MSKPTPKWTGDPTIMPKEYLTVCDVIGVNTNQQSGDTPNSITLNLGVAYTGESYTQDALMFQPAGFTSIPLGPGTVDQSTSNLSGSNTSQTSAQAVSYIRNDQYITLGFRDVRNQFTPGNLNPGETAVYASGSQARTTYKNDGSLTHLTLTPDGQGVYLRLSPTALTFVAPWGTYLLMPLVSISILFLALVSTLEQCQVCRRH